ncbi:MAG: serine/threonine protein kinase [Pyrinomonadaceae bacterium MAG19_C2-C3]|nr:serine/threonine protein kinase [Pyrinomonadaceae bacterium MAG19_C2-C3]
MSELRLQHSRIDNRYDVIERLGSPGSYAEIYIARDLQSSSTDKGGAGKLVVIKALNPFLQGVPDADLENKLIENFRNEAVAIDRVRHPHIISRLGHGTAIDLGGRTFHYLVLEYMEGGDLAALCRRQPLSVDAVLYYLEQVCDGLAYAHSKGVIHRDIKPHNLLLTADQKTVKIADFGVAKIKFIDGKDEAITRVGSDLYAPPEHHPLAITAPLDSSYLQAATLPGAENQGVLTPSADVYSLAKTAYMLLTGSAPREFSQRSITHLPPHVRQEAWAEAVREVLKMATQSNPAARYASVPAFWNAFRSAVTTHDETSTNGTVPVAPPIPVKPDFAHDIATKLNQDLQPAPEAISSAPPKIKNNSSPNRIVVDISDAPQVSGRARGNNTSFALNFGDSHEQAASSGFTQRSRGWIVALALIVFTAGMVLATIRYYRNVPAAATSNSNARTNARPNTGAGQVITSPVGREFLTTTDVNLRRGAGTDNPVVGKVPRNSRVRIVSEDNGWYNVVVVEYGAPKQNPKSADEGWLNKNYVRAR